MVADQIQAQEFAKVRSDYGSGAVTYSPADPWTRSKLFNTHTGHSGRFYNCDGEECKRNSPYICWKTNHQSLTPPRRGLLNQLRRDQGKIGQRIADGAGACSCPKCQSVGGAMDGFVETEQPTGGTMIAERWPTATSTNGQSLSPNDSRVKFGLVSHPHFYNEPEERLLDSEHSLVAEANSDFLETQIESTLVEQKMTKPTMGLLSQHPHRQATQVPVETEFTSSVPTHRDPSNLAPARSETNQPVTKHRAVVESSVAADRASGQAYGRSMIQFERPAVSATESPTRLPPKSKFSISQAVAVLPVFPQAAPAASRKNSDAAPLRTAKATLLENFAR
jgi:hypothetical protein